MQPRELKKVVSGVSVFLFLSRTHEICRQAPSEAVREREFLIDYLLVRIHLIIEMILGDRPCAMGV